MAVSNSYFMFALQEKKLESVNHIYIFVIKCKHTHKNHVLYNIFNVISYMNIMTTYFCLKITFYKWTLYFLQIRSNF